MRLFAYILIILFSFQVIPVRELGKFMFKKAATEQVQDIDEDQGAACKKKGAEGTKLLPGVAFFRLRQILSNRQAQTALHIRFIITPHFVPEIPTPPPNRC